MNAAGGRGATGDDRQKVFKQIQASLLRQQTRTVSVCSVWQDQVEQVARPVPLRAPKHTLVSRTSNREEEREKSRYLV